MGITCSQCGREVPAGESCVCESPTLGLSDVPPDGPRLPVEPASPGLDGMTPPIPGYRLLGLLGEGGMGSVHLAEDVALGRRVAIKLIRERLSGGSAGAARFLREARALASVEHPGIVRLYTFGETDGRPYFVMELVDGETLAERIARWGIVPLGEALRVLLEVADALEAAWEKGIVHRDVKPSNVLLDRKGRVRVADFGLAKPIRGSGEGELSLTGEGLILGTPAYVAPEQALGLMVDFRADVYALGCVLYEMLVGNQPFRGPSVLAVVEQHLHSRFPPLLERRPDLPAPVSGLVEWMTRREPSERPSSYAELRSRVASLLEDAGRSDATATSDERHGVRLPLSPPARPAARPRSSSLRSFLAGAAGLLFLGFLVFASARAVREGVDRKAPAGSVPGSGGFAVAVAPFHGPDEESARDGRMMAALVEKELRHRLRDVRVLGLDAVRESPRSSEAARELGARLGASVVVWGGVITFRGETEIQPTFTLVKRGPPPEPGEISASRGPGYAVDEALGLEQRGTGLVRLEARTPNQIDLRKTSAAGIGNAVLLLAALHALHAEDNPRKALALVEQAPTSIESLRVAAKALRLLGRPEEAAARLDEAARLAPEDPFSRSLLADWSLEAGRYPEAALLYGELQRKAAGTLTRSGALFEGKLYRQDVPDPDTFSVGLASPYLVALDPATGRTVERHVLPGPPLAYSVRGPVLRVSYDPGTARADAGRVFSPAPQEVEIAAGRILGHCALPALPSRLLLMRAAGWSLAANFSMGRTEPASPAWDGRYARLEMTKGDPDPRVPRRLEDLEAALRAAAGRDPTQPWHLFFLGQALRALGRDAEAEATFRALFSRPFPGTAWYEWSSMATAFERGGQPAWSDRAIGVALARRKEVLPPPWPGTLLERIVNGNFVRPAAQAREMSPLRRYELLRQSRVLTGPGLEWDDEAALLWARYFRRTGRDDLAAPEERLGLELAGSAAAGGRNIAAALRAVFVLGAGAVAGLALLLLVTFQVVRRVRAGPSGPPRLLRVFGALTRRERAALALAALLLPALLAAQRVLQARVFAGPFGLQDSLGHPAIAEALEARAREETDRHVVFLGATARHLEGSSKAARELYARIREVDPRAVENLAALDRREPPRRYPGLEDLEAAFGRLDPRAALPSWPAFAVAALFAAFLALLGGNPDPGPGPAAPGRAGRLVPGLLDVGAGRPLRAWATWLFLSFGLLATLWDLPGASMFPPDTAGTFPRPPGADDLAARLWLVLWAVPADRLWWGLVAASLVAGLALYLRSARASQPGRSARPSPAPASPP